MKTSSYQANAILRCQTCSHAISGVCWLLRFIHHILLFIFSASRNDHQKSRSLLLWLQSTPHHALPCILNVPCFRYLLTHNVWAPHDGSEEREATLDWPLLRCVVLWDTDKYKAVASKVLELCIKTFPLTCTFIEPITRKRIFCFCFFFFFFLI